MRPIVLTRPEGRNDALARAVTEALAGLPGGAEGYVLLPLPLLRIDPVSEAGRQSVLAAVTGMTADDWLIFVSPRAVQFAERMRPVVTWPAGRMLAVGSATAQALRRFGVNEPFLPQGTQDSEGLLAELDAEGAHVADRRIWIVRGDRGREKLARELTAAGAQVDFLPVYRRSCAGWPADIVAEGRLFREDTVWIVTASEALRCLLTQLRDAGRSAWEAGLLNSGLVVINRRTEAVARRLGFVGPIVCAGAPDDTALATAARQLLT